MSKAFLKHRHFLRDLNKTNITLIPKKNNPEKVNDYIHISFCNVFYKFISNLMANRLLLVLPVYHSFKVLLFQKGIFLIIS